MKKFIRISSLFGLLVVVSTISVTAQTGLGSEVDIQFAFNVGDKAYEAGSYVIKINRRIAGAATLSIRDTKTDERQTVLLSSNGEEGPGEMQLVFDTIEGQRYLTKVRTPERSYGLYRVKDAAAKSQGAGSDGSSPF